MGYNTVAVLYNDHTQDFRDDDRLGDKIADAMSQGWLARKHDPLGLYFGAGLIISQDHADGEQVVIVSRNSGCRAQDATDLGWQALAVMAECLERHGYTVTKKRKPKTSPTPAPSLGGEGREG